MRNFWKMSIACGILLGGICILSGCDFGTPVMDNLPEDYNEEQKIENNNVEENKEVIVSTNESLIFTDEAGDSTMTFLFEGQELKKVEWIIETGDVEVAKQLSETYQEEEYTSLYQVAVEDTKVFLTYTEEYVNDTFAGMTKEQIELALEADGYLIKSDAEV